MSTPLFRTVSGQTVKSDDLALALRAVGAHDCDVLFLHSGMSFGTPATSRREILAEMWGVVTRLGVKTLCVPVFTFSFPNNEVFDPHSTPSRMGAFSEFARRQPETIRSHDPLMSVALIGTQRDLVTDIGLESCGENSTFHKLSYRDGVKFLFLGVRAGDCFTYMHHLEWQAKVPYRYNRKFHGRVFLNGRETTSQAILNVRYKGVSPGNGSYHYENFMLQSGVMRAAFFGDGVVRCVAERDATQLYLKLLGRYPDFFITRPFDPSLADDTFEVNGVMVAM